MTVTKTYEVTGELDPDVTGTYEDVGEFNGKRSYELTGNGWFIWWDDLADWWITTERGTLGPPHWNRHDPTIEGVYPPTPPADGFATVTEI